MNKKEIAISIISPYVTKKVFEEVTGIRLSTINRMLKDGRLLAFKAPGEKSAVLINMYDFYRKAAEQSNIVNNSKN